MNFQNFYILISKRRIISKKFVNMFFIFTVMLLVVSFVLKLVDLNMNGNDTIRQYQLSKIKREKFQNVSTIIIGDSSGGNAIDAKYFTTLSGLKTSNLCLTGSWGVNGSLGILQNAFESNKCIKNVVIVQTAGIWTRKYSKEAMLELFSLSDIYRNLGINELIGYFFNPREIWWQAKYLIKIMIGRDNGSKMDLRNDYILQEEKKFSNSLKKIQPNISFNNLKISDDKITEFNSLQNYCVEHNLNCIFIHGPIHKQLGQNSTKYFNSVNRKLKKILKIVYINTIFKYPNEMMGDSNDHIDTEYKQESTKDYFYEVKEHLITYDCNAS